MLNINIIGCGKLGKTLGRLIVQYNLGNVQGILTSTLQSAEAAVKFIGSGKNVFKVNDLPQADIYFITTPDDLIETVCKELFAKVKIKKGAIFIHCSGSLTADVLQAARGNGCFAMSIHPNKSFANPQLAVKSFSGTYCAYEGDLTIFPVVNAMFSGMGAILLPIKKEQKATYHAAGVFANNYLVTLHHIASECYQLAGINEEIAYKIALMLMNDALQNLKNSDHRKALTGPLQRGDVATIKKHLSNINDLPILKAVYTALGDATISITRHNDQLKKSLTALLHDEQNIL